MKAILVITAILLLAIVSTNSYLAARSANVEKVPAPVPTAASSPTQVDTSGSIDQSDEASSDIKLVLLALRPEGFESSEMQLTAGEYLFIIGNRTGLDEVNVRFHGEGKERMAAGTVRGRRKGWKQRLKLTPGTYFLTVDGNPDWTCRIVVER
jgi:hypothetical protein